MYLFNEIGDVVFDHTGKFEIVRETFFGGAHNEGESFDEEFRDEVEKKVHDLKENKSKDGDEFLNRLITYEEVEASIQSLKKDKAPGLDTIFTDMLINSNDALKAVTILFQKSWNDGKLSDIWKSANVKFLAKPGKDSYYTESSYHPINLASVLGKCMERIIYARLHAFVEHHKILDSEQDGFRKFRGTTHSLLR